MNRSIFSAWHLLVFLIAGSVHAGTLNVPLNSKDPDQPIRLIADQTWNSGEITPNTGKAVGIMFEPFTTTGEGPVTLVVDYGATRTNSDRGEALLELYVECPEASEPCKLPINKAFMMIDSAFMGEAAAVLNQVPTALWVGRETQTFNFPADTVVYIGVSVANAPVNLAPRIVRARLIYGDHETSGLPGQQTRVSLFYKITGSALVLLFGFVWWIKKQ